MLGAVSAIWGASYLLIKIALDGFAPSMIVFARVLLAALLLYVVISARGGEDRAGDGRAVRGQGDEHGLLGQVECRAATGAELHPLVGHDFAVGVAGDHLCGAGTFGPAEQQQIGERLNIPGILGAIVIQVAGQWRRGQLDRHELA